MECRAEYNEQDLKKERGTGLHHQSEEAHHRWKEPDGCAFPDARGRAYGFEADEEEGGDGQGE